MPSLAEPQPQSLGLGEALILLITSPRLLFRRLGRRPESWPLALLLVGGPLILIAILGHPYYQRMLAQMDQLYLENNPIPARLLPQTVANSIFATLLSLLLSWLIVALALYLAGILLRLKVEFSPLFAVVAFASFPLIFRQLAIVSSWASFSFEVRSFADFLVFTRAPLPFMNLAFLAPVGSPLWALLTLVDPMTLISAWLVKLGLEEAVGLTSRQALKVVLSGTIILAALVLLAWNSIPQPLQAGS